MVSKDSSWSSKNLGDGILAAVPLGQIETQFQAAYKQAGSPEDMAVFVRYESEGHLHCEVQVYFSPAASEVAKGLGAEVCAKPFADGLDLLVGSEKAWRTLFPEQDSC